MPGIEKGSSGAIRETVLDYVEGWYNGEAERMRRCLHPELAKRAIKLDKDTGEAYFNDVTYEDMLVDTQAGLGAHLPEAQRVYDIQVLDICGEIASVRVDSPDWIDYLHLAVVEGRWVIVNALYTPNPDK
jgi:hypothetical protein